MGGGEPRDARKRADRAAAGEAGEDGIAQGEVAVAAGSGRLRVGIVCGLAAERAALGALARAPGVAVAVSGARPDVAEAEAARLAADGVGLLISFGLAGGLAPGLLPGDLVMPRRVVSEAGEAWEMASTEAAIDALPPALARRIARPDRLLGLERVAVKVTEKQALAAAAGAAAVDMESHRVARAAAAAGIPALAWRAIGDPAGRALPALAARAIRRDGRPDIPSVLLGLLRRPYDLATLLAAKRDSDAALASLSASAPALDRLATP
ncbi:MAG: hypothetical protein AAFV86_02360 [Pseudomonadota bacterium]